MKNLAAAAILLSGCTARADYMFEPGYAEAFKACQAESAAVTEAMPRFDALVQCLVSKGYDLRIHVYFAGFIPVRMGD
jgi:hypothetical protein